MRFVTGCELLGNYWWHEMSLVTWFRYLCHPVRERPVRGAQNRMTRDVLAHLRAISAQQSKIRGLRNKLAILREATARHADALGEFRVVRATAAAYSQCLAECMRRRVHRRRFQGVPEAGQGVHASCVKNMVKSLPNMLTGVRAVSRAVSVRKVDIMKLIAVIARILIRVRQ